MATPDPSPPDAEGEVRLEPPLDLTLTLGPLRHGSEGVIQVEPGRVLRATRTRDGAATVEFRTRGAGAIGVRAWGPGAARAVTDASVLLGARDDPTLLVALEAAHPHPLVHELARRFIGVRIPRTGAVLEALVPAILEQKVTGIEARGAYRRLVERYGEAAPGPFGMRLPPTAEVLADLPYHAYHPLGVEQRRAERIRRAAARGTWLEDGADLPLAEAYARLTSLVGIGPWSAAEVGRQAFGDPDAVSVGDFHLPNSVCWALAREPRGTDARMLELLEPYRGQRGRLARLIELAGIRAPRYGPRLSPRRIETL